MIPLLLPALSFEYELGMQNLRVSEASAGAPVLPVVMIDDKSAGFSQAVNRGLGALLGDPDWLCLCVLACDLRYEQQGWLVRMQEVLLSDPTFGFVGPSVQCGTHPQNKGRPGLSKGFQVTRQLNFTGVLVRRETIEAVGLLDEDLVHYGTDYDYIHRSQEQGWKAVWCHDVWCVHDWDGKIKHPEFVAADRALYYSRWTRTGMRIHGN